MNTKDKKRRRFTPKQIRKIYDCHSLYQTIHLLDEFDSGEIQTVGDMHINPHTAEVVYKQMQDNWMLWRKKRGIKTNTEQYIHKDQQQDWLVFAPKTDKDCEEWCIEWM